MSTTKRDLVMKIAEKTEIKQLDVYKVIQNTLDYITESLARGENVELRNFGVFEVRERKQRVGRNPNKPEQVVTIPSRKVVKFKPGKIMRQQVSDGGVAESAVEPAPAESPVDSTPFNPSVDDGSAAL
jgi:nucleoid DNA-binding protein